MTQQEFFNRYTYSLREDKLGGGSFGTVYKAYDNVLDKTVAIKIAEVKTFGDKSFSLLDEFEAIRELPPHVNIANYEEVFTFEQPNGVFDYAIIQYYPHGNLSDLIKTENLTQEQKEDISLQILEGLRFLHHHKVVHRDMKPSNILIQKRKNGRIIPKIADFGLSKKAEPGAQSCFTNSFGGGTLEYSSPEQLRGLPLRFNTDLWAWAVITYELFTGKSLFQPAGNHSTGSAEREKELFEHILNKDISVSLSVLPKKWQNVLQLCLQRDADKRMKTVEQIKMIIDGEHFVQTQEAMETTKKSDKTVIECIPPTPRPKLEPTPQPKRKSESTPKQSTPTKSKTGLWIGMIILLLSAVGVVFWQRNNKTLKNQEDSYNFVPQVNDSITPSNINNEFNVVELKVNRLSKSNYDKNIEFKADLLLFPDITNNNILNILYGDFLPYKNFVGITKNELKNTVEHIADDYIRSNMKQGQESNEYDVSNEWSMRLHFCNQHFICVEVHNRINSGTGTGGGVFYTTKYKNIDYINGKEIKIAEIVNSSILTKELLHRCFKQFARDDSGRNVDINDLTNELYYPKDFTFDKDGILFIFPKYEIGYGYQGEITFNIPFYEIESGLLPDFKNKTQDSQSIKINVI